MLRDRFKYDPKTDSYVRVRNLSRYRFFSIIGVLGLGLAIGVGLYILSAYFIGSPKQQRLEEELAFMELQYQILQERVEGIEEVQDDMVKRDENIYRIVFEAEPIPKSARNIGLSGSKRYEQLFGYQYSDLLVSTKEKVDRVAKKMYVQSRSFDEIVELASNKQEMLRSIPAIQPVANKDLTRMASGYGWRMHPIYKTRKFHYGMDFTAPRGTPIYATGDGKVIKAVKSKRGYGNSVEIDHGFGYKSLYAHMQSFEVSVGQSIQRGEIVGYVGNTGLSTAPHLHYEIKKNDEKVNPVNYYFNDLTPEEYERMLELSKQENQSFD